jgi:hypothetical protein
MKNACLMTVASPAQCRHVNPMMPAVRLLIYVIFHATLHECLSVSNISELSSRRFSVPIGISRATGSVP